MNTARPAQKALLDALNELTEVQMKLSRDTLLRTVKISPARRLILMGLAVLSILLAVATCMITVRVLMRQLGGEPAQAQTLAAAIAGGDLSSPVALRRNDTSSLLASLAGMQSNLRSLVSDIAMPPSR